MKRPGNLIFSDRQILLRAAPPPAGQSNSHCPNLTTDAQPKCTIAVVPAVGKTGYALEAAIPRSALGIDLTPGREILFDIAVNDATNGRRTIVWNGTAADSKERDKWGLAEIAP
jgi:hypothetical protein